jgi:hypothetical protein
MGLCRIENGDDVVALFFDTVIASLRAAEAATATMDHVHRERSAEDLAQLPVGVRV